MSRLFRFNTTFQTDPDITRWFQDRDHELGAMARRWFSVMHRCGKDVTQILHDGHPTVCVQNVAFAYVNAFTAHVNVGFFHGAELPDPEGLLEGSGKFMRHVKLRPGLGCDENALVQLIETAYRDVKERLSRSTSP